MSSAGTGATGTASAQTQDAGGDWKGKVLKGLAIYLGVNAVSNFLLPKATERSGSVTSPESSSASPLSTAPSLLDKLGVQPPQQPVYSPPSTRVSQNTQSKAVWPPTSELDFYVFLSHAGAPSHEDIATQRSTLAPNSHPLPLLEDVIHFDAYPSLPQKAPFSGDYQVHPAIDGTSLPIIRFGPIKLSDARLKEGLTADIEIITPDQVMNSNGSLWADIVAVGSGVDVRKSPHHARVRKMLTRLYPARRHREGRRLLGGSDAKSQTEEEEEDDDEDTSSAVAKKQLVPYWHRNLTLAIPEQQASAMLAVGSLPPPLTQHIHLVKNADDSLLYAESVDNQKRNVVYNYPVIFPNTFWDLREDMYPVNSTTDKLPLHISLYTQSWFKFQILAAMGDSFEKQPGMAGNEIDMVKRTLMTTSPYFLVLTLVVTLLHSLFEFLAFSSEVTFWKKKENFAGVSVGSIVTSIVTQTIILLYLLDSSEETSWVILGSQGVGIVIEAWKLTKAVTVSIKRSPPGSLLPYRFDVKDKHVPTQEELETKAYDRQAFKIVAYLAVPLLGGYTIYSALYQEHKGWWSFIIGTLTSFVYTFGFVSLIPQLIVNHKMKSVAGLPPNALIYKILNTFVDDLFAFVVKMPLLHRLATLRDDVVFFVYLYQWWKYGVDLKRPNEFGQILDADARKALQEKEGDSKTEAKLEDKKDK